MADSSPIYNTQSDIIVVCIVVYRHTYRSSYSFTVVFKAPLYNQGYLSSATEYAVIHG